MFGRKFKSDYKSKKYIGCEEGTNLAVDIALPPKYNPIMQLISVLCFAGIILNIFFSFEVSVVISLGVTTICLYSITEPIK